MNTTDKQIGDNLFQQITNISKAHAYDIVSEQAGELKEQNTILKAAIKKAVMEILALNAEEVIKDPSAIIGRISSILTETFKLRPL